MDDYIAPVIDLNTDDTILHDVNEPYYSRAVTVSDNYYPLNKLSVTKTGTVDPYTLEPIQKPTQQQMKVET